MKNDNIMNPRLNEYDHHTYYETLVETLVWATGEAQGNLDAAEHAQRCSDDGGLSPHSPRYLINKHAGEFWRQQLSYWEPVQLIDEESLMAELRGRPISQDHDVLFSSRGGDELDEGLRAQARARRAEQIRGATAQLERWITDGVDREVTDLARKAVEEATAEEQQRGTVC
jgi:hypothetical protein